MNDDDSPLIYIPLTSYEVAALISLLEGISKDRLDQIFDDIFKLARPEHRTHTEQLKIAIAENLLRVLHRLRKVAREIDKDAS